MKQILNYLGVQNTVANIYLRLRGLAFTLPDTYTTQYKGVEATFNINNQMQYKRAKGVKEELMSRLLEEIRSDNVFYDIGANVGSVSCLLGAKISSGEIIAFEPFPPNAAALQENLSLNGISGSVYEYALSDEEGEVQFRIAESDFEPGSTNAISPEKENVGFF